MLVPIRLRGDGLCAQRQTDRQTDRDRQGERQRHRERDREREIPVPIRLRGDGLCAQRERETDRQTDRLQTAGGGPAQCLITLDLLRHCVGGVQL